MGYILSKITHRTNVEFCEIDLANFFKLEENRLIYKKDRKEPHTHLQLVQKYFKMLLALIESVESFYEVLTTGYQKILLNACFIIRLYN